MHGHSRAVVPYQQLCRSLKQLAVGAYRCPQPPSNSSSLAPRTLVPAGFRRASRARHRGYCPPRGCNKGCLEPDASTVPAL
eukprot:14348311-Heterocapsa_arctica.AAC.1